MDVKTPSRLSRKKTRENYFFTFQMHTQTGNAENKHGDCFLSTSINIEIESYLNNSYTINDLPSC
jgi:hypothetical protein